MKKKRLRYGYRPITKRALRSNFLALEKAEAQMDRGNWRAACKTLFRADLALVRSATRVRVLP